MLIGSTLPFLIQDLQFAPIAGADHATAEWPSDDFLKWLPVLSVEGEIPPVDLPAQPSIGAPSVKSTVPGERTHAPEESAPVQVLPAAVIVRLRPALVEMAPEMVDQQAPETAPEQLPDETAPSPPMPSVEVQEAPVPLAHTAPPTDSPAATNAGPPAPRPAEPARFPQRAADAIAVEPSMPVEDTPVLKEAERPAGTPASHADLEEVEVETPQSHPPQPQPKPGEQRVPERAVPMKHHSAEPAAEEFVIREKPAPPQAPESVENRTREAEPERVRTVEAADPRPAPPEAAAPPVEPKGILERPRTNQVEPPKPSASVETKSESDVDRPAQTRPLSFLRVTTPTPSGGKVEVIARQRGDLIEATVKAGDPALHTVLRRHLPAEMNDLRSAGISSVEIVPPRATSRVEERGREDASSSSHNRPQHESSQDRRGRQRHAWDFEEFELQ